MIEMFIFFKWLNDNQRLGAAPVWSTLTNLRMQMSTAATVKYNVIGCFVIYSFVENMDSFLAGYKSPIK